MEQNLSPLQIGMKFKNPSSLKEGEFSLLLNGRIQTVSGNILMVSNDSSNLLATRFKEGFKVIGTYIVPSLSITFFFLTNPSTNESEIGFLYDAVNQDKPDPITPEGKVIFPTPLEQTEQLAISVYYTFVNANCLNFDIDHPVQSWVKIDDCNVRIYFNDFKNPPRYIDYENFQKIDLSNCPLIETNELDCDKIKIFPESCYPTVEVIDVVSGGNNQAGVYQFTIAYSDVNSNKITDYFYISNPIPLFDKPITIPTDYPVSKSFKLQISNLNTDFKYFNLVVLKTINKTTTPYLINTFEVNSSNFEYVFTGNVLENRISIDEILAVNPIYNKAKGLTESGGYLFQYTLEEDRIFNLQPVMPFINPKWQTVEMNDGDYANPIIAQNYTGYLGDETYAFGLAFTKTNTKETRIFPLIGRTATSYDLESVCFPTPSGECTNPDVIFNSSCDTQIRDLRWQVYNTASVIDNVICTTPTPSGEQTVEITDQVECQSDQILINSIQSYDPLTGEIVYTTVPSFWVYPPDTVVYPPLNSQQALELENYTNDPINSLPSIQNDQTQQDRIDLCDCASLLPNYPPDATYVTEPIIIDPYSDDSSIEIIKEETVITNNTYDLTSVPEIPRPGGYPYVPTPCLKYVSDENNLEKGYKGFLQNKQNTSAGSAETIIQSDSPQCSDVETWGSFISDDEVTSDSWYQFYCNNQEGVASIILSTDKTSNNGSQNNASFIVYEVNSVNGQGNEVYPTNNTGTTITSYTVSNNDGQSVVLVGLKANSAYFIKVIGNYPKPVDLLGISCKRRSFKLCVTTPNPATSNPIIVPGIARITKTCTFTYQGIPQSSCEPQPDKYGEFSYIESQETYPCNEELYGELAGKPIRHFKFPDHNIVPFFEQKGSTPNSLSTKINKIYPKGVRIDINEIKFALNKAVELGLISQEERNQICGYRIYRSNRRGNESIIAKGLLYDIWEYKDNVYNTGNKILFPNFPYNDNRPNQFISTKKVTNNSIAASLALSDAYRLRHPFPADFKNSRYTLDAPNLSFNNPSGGTELKIEFEQVGTCIGNYNELKNNSKYQYIGPGIISAAIGFASVEAAFEALNVMVNATLTLPITVLGSGTSIPLGLILALIGENIISPVRMYSHYSEWYEIIRKFAPYRNYGVTYSSVGKYVEHVNNDPILQNTRRAIANSQYVKPGIINVKTIKGNTRFNNFKRDSSFFIELVQNSFFAPTQTQDTSRSLPANCQTTGVTGTIASYYASLKTLQLSQYGQIDNIEWIDTGYNGRIDWNNPNQDTTCDTIFGGDTYITRFTKKRKTPVFLDDRVIPSDATQTNLLNQDIQMSLLPNIGYPTYFMDYPTALDYTGISNGLFGDVAVLSKTRADYNFFCFSSDGQTWKDTGLAAAILGSFAGISFGVISLPIAVTAISVGVKRDLGNDLFLRGKYVHSFYGIISFLCESNYNLDLRHGEDFKAKDFYPNVGDTNQWTQEYFVPISEDNYYIYNEDYSKQNKENPNVVLNNNYSREKEDCKVSHPNTLIYSLQDNDQNDNFDGNLIFLANNRVEFPKSAGALQIVRGLSNGKVLAIQENGYSVFNSFISQQTNIGISTVGSNSLFNPNIPIQTIKTDLGIGGSQTPAIAVTEFGAFWVDNKRGSIFKFDDSLNNIIKLEDEWWFKENLPFKILNDFPDFDITNNYKYIGMAITYDAKYKRVFFTKRDVELKPEYKNKGITLNGDVFTFNGENFTVESQKYFCNKSFTISYNPVLEHFISFHSFIPNYYIPNQQYFSTGYNYLLNSYQSGAELYYHNLTNQSYQVYNGILYPFTLEYTLPTKYQNKQLESIRYFADFYRYQDNISSGLVPDITYNKALIYNQKQTSGTLELVPKIKNNRYQFLQYPKQNLTSRSILVESIERGFNFNDFYDVAIENSGQPLLSYQCNNIAYKDTNLSAITYRPQYLKKKLVSDFFSIRLTNDSYSNFNILHRFSINDTQNINQ